jgi:hypothetical protein
MEKLKLIEAVSELKNLGAISSDSALCIIGLLVSLPEDMKAYVKKEEQSRESILPELEEIKPKLKYVRKATGSRGHYLTAESKAEGIARSKIVYIKGLNMSQALLRGHLKDNSVNRALLSKSLGSQLRPMGTGLHSLRGKHSKRLSNNKPKIQTVLTKIPRRGGANDRSRIRMKFIQERVKSLTKAYDYSYETAFRQASAEWNKKTDALQGIKLIPPVILSEPSQNKALISALGQAVFSGKPFAYGDYQLINPDSDIEEWSRISMLVLFNSRKVLEFLGLSGRFKIVKEGQSDTIHYEK